jgi:ABC-2 type transport system ATP-binding protein
MDEAEHCDRIWLMRAGRLLADATREELLERSATDSVEHAFLRLVEAREQAG